MTAPLRGLRALLVYTAFDLRTLAGNVPLLGFLLGGPALLLIPVAIASLGTPAAAPRGPPQHLVVVAPDDRLHATLRDRLAGSAVTVEIVAEEPPDADRRLEGGAIDVLVVLAPDFATSATLSRTEGRGGWDGDAQRIASRIRRARVEARVREAGGDRPIVVVGRDGAVLSAPESEPAAVAATAREAEVGPGATGALGLLVVGVFGTGVGLGVGPALARSIRTGFNHVLSLGTAPHVIYGSELLTYGIVQGTQAALWWAALLLAGGVAGSTRPIDLPPPALLVRQMPLFAGLAVVAAVQAATLSLVAARAADDLPQGVRDRGPGLVIVPLLLGATVLLDLDGSALAGLAALPVVGPVALWLHHVHGGSGVGALALVQLGWCVVAVALGARVFALDESPQAHLARWWRRRRTR